MPSPSTAPVPTATRYCLSCDYPLDGLAERRCPECGQEFDPDNPATFRPYPRALHRKSQSSFQTLLAAVFVVALLMVLIRVVPGVFGAAQSDWPTYAVLIVALLVVLDARAVSRMITRGKQHLDAMQWEALIRHHERMLRSWRPLMLLIRNVSARGALELEFATDLYHIGQLDRALSIANQGMRRARGKKKATMVTAGLDLRAKIHLTMGSYKDARADLEMLGGYDNRRVSAQSMLALLEIEQGKLHEAVQRLRPVVQQTTNHPDVNSARLHLSTALYLMGRFDEALEVLDHPFIDVFGYLDPGTAKTLLRTAQGAGRLEWVRLRYARTMVAARLHAAARVHLERKDHAKAVAAVDEVAAMLGEEPAHPWTKHEQFGYRAICFAEAGAVEEAMTALHDMWEISSSTPAPALAVGSRHFAGSVARSLGKHDEAIQMFEEGLNLCIHPIQKQGFAYWLAVSARAAGKADVAAVNYDRVIADGFDTWMHRESLATMRQPGHAQLPKPDVDEGAAQ